MYKIPAAVLAIALSANAACAADLGGMKDGPSVFDAGVQSASVGGAYITFGIGGSFVKSGKDVVTYVPDGTYVTTTASTATTIGYLDSKGVYHSGKAPDGTTVTPGNYVSSVGTKSVTSKANYGLSGAMADVRLGYDFRLGGGWFFGPYAGASYDWASDSDMSRGFGYEGGIRLGDQIGNVRFGVETGYRGEHVGGTLYSADAKGFLIGTFAEANLSQHMVAGLRADYVTYGNFTAADGFSVSDEQLIGLLYVGARF